MSAKPQQSTLPLSAPSAAPAVRSVGLAKHMQQSLKLAWKYRWIYILMIPSLLYFVIFRYGPLWNAQIAFKDFQPRLGVWDSPWVGQGLDFFTHFQTFIDSFYFEQLIGNTIIFSLARLLLGLPIAVILALILYETQAKSFRTFVQTIVYLPHFLSWVIMFGLLLALLSPTGGLINEVIQLFGGEPVNFLTSPQWFRPVVILSDIWKETGWSTIIYLAALLTINTELYEAATVDGASKLRRIWHIALPEIFPVILLVTLLRLGHILEGSFNQIFVLYSVPVYAVGDIIDTWVYRQGILDFQFSLATAVGLFKGVIGLCLLLVANRVAKAATDQSLF